MPKLPYELLDQITKSLSTDLKTLNTLLYTSKNLFNVTIPYMYSSPKFGNDAIKWRSFVRLMLASIAGKTTLPYHQYIQSIDEICLYVGGEDDVPPMEMLARRDSAFQDEFPLYSAHHLMALTMMYSPLSSIKLHFLSHLIRDLPWALCTRLKSLEIRTRLTDTMITAIKVTNLTHIKFAWAEISDVGVVLIGQTCPQLEELYIHVSNTRRRSRNARLPRPHFDIDDITDVGLTKLAESCPNLSCLHIFKLFHVSAETMYSFMNLRRLTLTLCASRGITIDWILDSIGNITDLEIIGSDDEESLFVDRVITEANVFALPARAPTLQTLTLAELDFNRDDQGMNMYYIVRGLPMWVGELMKKFAGEFPNVQLFVKDQLE